MIVIQNKRLDLKKNWIVEYLDKKKYGIFINMISKTNAKKTVYLRLTNSKNNNEDKKKSFSVMAMYKPAKNLYIKCDL